MIFGAVLSTKLFSMKVSRIMPQPQKNLRKLFVVRPKLIKFELPT